MYSQAITGFVLPAQTFSTACVLHDGSAPASPDAPSVRASPDAPTGEPGKPNNLDFNGSVLVKVGDGKDSLFKHQDLMPMDRMTLVVTMSESKAFRVKLKDVPLDDCPVLVTASTKDEPTAAEWKAAVELKGAKTLRGCIKELEASGLLPAGASVFIHLLLPAAASDGKSFVLLVTRHDDAGDVVQQHVAVTVRDAVELKALIRDNGGGNLALAGQAIPERVSRLEQIKGGETYELLGGSQDAARHHKMWTQVSDKALEADAFACILRDEEYGRLEAFVDYDRPDAQILRTADGTEMEIDALAVNGTTAVVVEAKHHAHDKHIEIALEKARHVARVCSEGRIQRLKPIKRVIPVLASNLFPSAVHKLCQVYGVGVVRPTGARLGFISHPPVAAAVVVGKAAQQ